MHFQSPIQNWPAILAVAPERCFIKAFEGGMLAQAKAEWTRLGRDRSTLHTDFRFYDFVYPFDRPHTFDELRAIWRANFFKFVDRTYLEQYAAHIDSVEELNEYTDTRMVTDKALLRPYIESCRAAVAVWNGEFRGRRVTAPDGGVGNIPAGCRLVICNSPVGNDIPPEFFQLAVESDSVLGIHPYSKWENRTRDPQDFRFHSGRPYFNEQEYGIQPVYAPTENGPYLDAANGWRYSGCMNGDLALLVSGMRSVMRDTAQVAAYREGRILGPGAFFTSGGFGWEMYQYTTGDLTALYNMLAAEWKPPAQQEPDMDTQTEAKVGKHAQGILTILWMSHQTVPFDIPPQNKVIQFFHKDGSPFAPPITRNVTWAMRVVEKTVDMMLVLDQAGTANDWWVKAEDITP